MSYVRTFRRGGLGQSASQIVGEAGGVVSPVVSVLAGPAAATALGISASVAIPIVGAAFAGVMLGIEAILNSGCGQTCIQTSEWANQASAKLDELIAAYFALPAPRSQSAQQIYLQTFQAVWNTLVQQCSQPNLGTAGQNCISDRQDGACKWKAAAPAYPGEPAEGSCWNWWNAYYWPVANDPNVVPDSQMPAGVSTQLAAASGTPTDTTGGTDTSTSSIPTWAWFAAAGLALWLVVS